jgi:putative iron-dependent peroxidase
MTTPRPQPVLADLTKAAIFVVLLVEDGGEATTRDLLCNLDEVTAAVSALAPEGGLELVAGIASGAYDRLIGGPRPAHLHTLPVIAGDKHAAVSTPGDLLFHLRANSMDLCFELESRVLERLTGAVTVVDEVLGFGYFDERNLLGFVDGTANPEGAEAADAVVIKDDDPDFAGGSYVIVQKYLHDIDAWNAMPVDEQERIIGRTKADDIEFDDAVKPTNSHVAASTLLDADGNERQILRRNMPFGRPGADEFGTFFIGYAADPAVTEQMLVNMFVGRPEGNYDRILDFSTAVTGTLFFVPSVDQLRALAPTVADSAEPTLNARAADESLGIGSLNHLIGKVTP